MIILKGQARFFNDGLILDSAVNYDLFKRITENLDEMYGENPDPAIEKRVRDEWVWMQQEDMFFTICQLAQIRKNQFSFTPRITSIDNTVNFLTMHQFFQKIKAFYGLFYRL